jgi:pyrimidine operon attenuation protein/uracil phosphoribosyltransferase
MSSSHREQRLCLYDGQELQAILTTMALQAAALLPPGKAALVGILRRGEPLARLLQERMAQLTGRPLVPLYSLHVKRYADDLSLLHADTLLSETPQLAALPLRTTPLLVVDDVLYEGHSLLRTCAYLAQLGAQEIRTAVLVDRQACKQPVHADIVGVRLQIAPGDIIECNVPPYEAQLQIDLLRRGACH